MGFLDQKQLLDWDRFQRAVFLSGSYTWKLKLIVSWKTNGLAWTHKTSGQAFNKCMPAYKSPILAWQTHPLVTETSTDSDWKCSGWGQSKWGRGWSTIKLIVALNVSCSVTSSCTLTAPCSAKSRVEFGGVAARIHRALCIWWDP